MDGDVGELWGQAAWTQIPAPHLSAEGPWTNHWARLCLIFMGAKSTFLTESLRRGCELVHVKAKNNVTVSTYNLAVYISNIHKTSRSVGKKEYTPWWISGADDIKKSRSLQNQKSGEGSRSLNPMWSRLPTASTSKGKVGESPVRFKVGQAFHTMHWATYCHSLYFMYTHLHTYLVEELESRTLISSNIIIKYQ